MMKKNMRILAKWPNGVWVKFPIDSGPAWELRPIDIDRDYGDSYASHNLLKIIKNIYFRLLMLTLDT